jgi:hypothetical protein
VGNHYCPGEERLPQQKTGRDREEAVSLEAAPSERDKERQAPETAAIRMAVSVRLGDEMAGRDEDRATRYVATVRPTRAAGRYKRRAREETTGLCKQPAD